MNNNNFINENKYKIIINDINNIFNNAEDDIKKYLLFDKGIKSRNSKLSFKDTLLYSFNYCKLNETKLKIVSDFNFKNNYNNNNSINNYISRTSFS